MMHKAFFLPESPANPDSLPFDREHPWLAPLAGYSDLPFRLLCRQYGAAVCVTEMVSAKGLVYRSPGTGELLQSLPEDQPLVVQLFGAEASFLQRAVEMLRDVGYGWFDLNMGCSVAKVLKQGAGAAMLGDVPNALEVARAMLQAAGPGRVGFKIRLGLDSQRHVWRDLSLRLQDLGAGWITLHPRTARQGFGGEAAHEVLAELKQALDIPLIASGDLFSARDGLRVLEQTGVDTVMYARGAMHGPAIFDDHLRLCRGEEPQPPSPAALRAMVLRHMELAQELCPGRAALWKMRSVVPRYVRSLPGVKALRLELCRCTSWVCGLPKYRLVFITGSARISPLTIWPLSMSGSHVKNMHISPSTTPLRSTLRLSVLMFCASYTLRTTSSSARPSMVVWSVRLYGRISHEMSSDTTCAWKRLVTRRSTLNVTG